MLNVGGNDFAPGVISTNSARNVFNSASNSAEGSPAAAGAASGVAVTAAWQDTGPLVAGALVAGALVAGALVAAGRACSQFAVKVLNAMMTATPVTGSIFDTGAR